MGDLSKNWPSGETKQVLLAWLHKTVTLPCWRPTRRYPGILPCFEALTFRFSLRSDLFPTRTLARRTAEVQDTPGSSAKGWAFAHLRRRAAPTAAASSRCAQKMPLAAVRKTQEESVSLEYRALDPGCMLDQALSRGCLVSDVVANDHSHCLSNETDRTGLARIVACRPLPLLVLKGRSGE